jgi:hypothetical protein
MWKRCKWINETYKPAVRTSAFSTRVADHHVSQERSSVDRHAKALTSSAAIASSASKSRTCTQQVTCKKRRFVADKQLCKKTNSRVNEEEGLVKPLETFAPEHSE